MESAYNLNFIKESDFNNEIKNLLDTYNKNLKSMTLKDFNKNLIDPIKLYIDKAQSGSSWEEIINKEIIRQCDKSNNNGIGYLHQNMFKHIKNCKVPKNGEQDGFDVIYQRKKDKGC